MKNKIELGKEYSFAGYRWVPVHINKEDQVAVMQSLGVTAGPWPGLSMSLYGNGDFYDKDIFGEDISSYNEATEKLMEQIRPVAVDTVSGRGLYLASFKDIDSVEDIRNNSVWENALIKAASSYKSFGISNPILWLSTAGGKDCAWYINSYGDINYGTQYNDYVIAPAFNLDLTKVEIEGDEIKEKVAVTCDKIAIIPENTGKGEPEETNFILLLRLLEAFTPVCHGILSNGEIQMIQKYLCIQNRSVISLRNLRDFVVLFLADKADIERRNGNNEKFFQLMDIQSGIVSVIDQQIWNLSGEV